VRRELAWQHHVHEVAFMGFAWNILLSGGIANVLISQMILKCTETPRNAQKRVELRFVRKIAY
jgi:hypothetical protein